jgi:Viral BACON domain
VKRFLAGTYVLFGGILLILLFFGSQLQVSTVFAVPGFTSSNNVPLGANTCAGSGCHTNIGSPGSAVVSGFPSGMAYTPGTPIPLTVTITDTTQNRYGFELTSRLASNTATQAGSYAAGTNSNLGTDVVPVVQGLANSSTFNFTWTPPATASGNVNFYLSGFAGSFPNADIYTAMYTLTPAAAATPNFSLSATGASVVAGSTGTSALTVTPSGGFTGSIALTSSGLPTGVTLSPSSVTASSTLTLTAASTAVAGTYPITLTGTSGTLTHTANFNLTVTTAAVPNFSLSASPSSVTVAPGASATSTIMITPSGGFNSSSVSFTPPGLPTGVTASFSPISSAGTSTLTLTASSTAASITAGIPITGTSGTLSHSTTVTLTVAASSGGSALTVAPSLLTFDYSSGGAIPQSQNLTLTTKSGSLSYTATSSGGPWLTETPASGTAPGTIAVSVNPAGLASGTYSGAIHVTPAGGSATNIPVTLRVTSTRHCDDDNESCSGGGTSMLHAVPFVNDPNSSRTLTSIWVSLLGEPTTTSSSTGDPGLVLSKDATAPSGTQAGVNIRYVQASLTELGYDIRVGGQCTATSPRFVIVTTLGVTHTLGGCSKATITPAPTVGWNRVRFNLTDPAIQTSPSLVPGDVVSSITLLMDVAASADPASAGGLVVIDSIDVNGTFVGR